MKRVIRSNASNEEVKRQIKNRQAYKQHKLENKPPYIIDVVFEVNIEVDNTITVSSSSVFDDKFINGIPTVKHPKSSAKPHMSETELDEYNSLITYVCSALRGVYSKKGLEYIGYKLRPNSYSCYVAFLSATANEYAATRYENWMFRFRISDHIGKGGFSKSAQKHQWVEKEDGILILKSIVIGEDGDCRTSFTAGMLVDKFLRSVVSGEFFKDNTFDMKK